jgi:hypothetical protein
MPGVEGAGAVAEPNAGFVVTIVGYSPYKNIGELVDPAGVEDKLDKWGFVTRLLHLDGIVKDVNSPFKLYKKAEVEHFKLQIGEVGLGAEMPTGIGDEDIRFEKTAKPVPGGIAGGEQVLIDPMTKEVISKVSDTDELGKPKLDRSGKPVYKVNDYWFILNAKFVWKDAPKIKQPAVAQPAVTYTPPPTSPTRTTGTESPSSGRRKLGGDIE